MNFLHEIIIKNANEMLDGVNCSIGAAVQPITTLHMQAARDKGGDAIDLDPARGNFVSMFMEHQVYLPFYLRAHSAPFKFYE